MRARGGCSGWLIGSCLTILSAPAFAQDAPATPRADSTVSRPDSSTSGQSAPSAPFGPGHAVHLDSSRPFTYAWIARGVVSTERSYPDPFTKVGRLPIVVQLPAGKYTLLVEGDEISSGSTVFEVQDGPRSVKVQAGSGGLRELSGWMMAIGAAAALAGGVLFVSGTSNDEHDRKDAIALPLAIGGGVLVAGGVGLYLGSTTGFRVDPAPHSQAFSRPILNTALSVGGRW